MENYKEGSDLPVQSFRNISKEQVLTYANVSGDMNTIHLNREAARHSGFDREVVQGMWSMGIVTASIHRWFGPQSFIKEFTCRFTSPMIIGDSLLVCGSVVTVTAVDIEISIEGVNQEGSTILKNRAIVRRKVHEG
ncbi:hypothetical protein MUN89_03590 [Halobacillus salinarum]|uniref:MaoC-like domain-containing protein n=1 Tax=Halobacillus salinarum TaxID=2932257 RepID=A0ABY4EMG5_9BACI|nr:MaoC/PaaZ C-terminal domain-containing protein [Halobacillus salinarum]UOQ45048.1 hypothetical protein MUN89_03590 [Halobacillus salinarum]